MPIVQRPDGRLTVITGASRSGKTTSALRQTERAKRLIVWDHQGNWAAHGIEAVALAALPARLLASSRSSARLAVKSPTVNALAFDRFAYLALRWGMLAPCTVVAEELADVTTPGKAPVEWGALIRGGLKYGIDVIAITQSPAESDKTIMRNASVIRCFRMGRARDRAYMAAELDVPLAEVEALQPLEYIEATPGIAGSRPTHGALVFPAPRKPSRK